MREVSCDIEALPQARAFLSHPGCTLDSSGLIWEICHRRLIRSVPGEEGKGMSRLRRRAAKDSPPNGPIGARRWV